MQPCSTFERWGASCGCVLKCFPKSHFLLRCPGVCDGNVISLDIYFNRFGRVSGSNGEGQTLFKVLGEMALL